MSSNLEAQEDDWRHGWQFPNEILSRKTSAKPGPKLRPQVTSSDTLLTIAISLPMTKYLNKLALKFHTKNNLSYFVKW